MTIILDPGKKYRSNPDGSRTYSNGYTYHPKRGAERIYNGPQYEGRAGQWYRTRWLDPMVNMLADNERDMPETIPDEECFEHEIICSCVVCTRPESLWWRRHRRNGLTLEEARRQGLRGPQQSGRK